MLKYVRAPLYHVAIAIEMTSEENLDNTNHPENANSDSNYPSRSHEDSEIDHDETDSKINFAAKSTRQGV